MAERNAQIMLQNMLQQINDQLASNLWRPVHACICPSQAVFRYTYYWYVYVLLLESRCSSATVPAFQKLENSYTRA